jgi:hypothetical protein
MSNYKTDQCRILYRGKEFHFVSYEGVLANPAKGEVAAPAMWYLMRAGHRHAVMPQVAGQEELDRDRQLTEWLDSNAFVPAPPPRPAPRRRSA